MTPLNGGDGFTWTKEVNLWWYRERTRKQGELLLSPHDRIHTIKVKRDTVLLLTQMRDKFPIEVPSQAYSFGSKALKPDTSGLYDTFTEDEIKNYLKRLEELGVSYEVETV
jgi:hypothetical protein